MKLSQPSLAGLAPLVWATYCHRLGAPTGGSCVLATGSDAPGSPRTVGLGSGLGGPPQLVTCAGRSTNTQRR